MILMGNSSLGTSKEGYKFSVTYNGTNEAAALKELYGLISSFEKYGFPSNDLELVKKKLHTVNENLYKGSKSQISSKIADEIISYEHSGDVYIDYEQGYLLQKKYIDEISLAEVNKRFKEIINIQDRVIVFINTGQNILETKELLKIIEETKQQPDDLSKGEKNSLKLLNKKLLAKKIVSKKYNEEFDFYEYELQNGIKAVFKQTDYEKQKVYLKGFSFGGSSLYEQKDLNDMKKAVLFTEASGAGDVDVLELSKILAGKTAKVKTFINTLQEGIEASCSTWDIDSMFELLYLKLSEPKIDETVVQNIKKMLEYKVEKGDRNPSFKFNKELESFYYLDHPRILFDTKVSIKKLDGNNMLRLFKERFADMGDFVFVIAGDASTKDVEKMLCVYLSNLPVKKGKESYIDREITYKKGTHKFIKNYNNKDISNISIKYKAGVKYDFQTDLELGVLRSILSTRLREYIREEKSGVYGIRVKKSLSRLLKDESTLSISFSCDPKRADELTDYVYKQIAKLKREGVSETELKTYSKKFAVSFDSRKDTPTYWMGILGSYYNYGISLGDQLAVKDAVSKIKKEDIKELAKLVFSNDILESRLIPKE